MCNLPLELTFLLPRPLVETGYALRWFDEEADETLFSKLATLGNARDPPRFDLRLNRGVTTLLLVCELGLT